MSNDHGSNGPVEHAADTTTPPSAVANAIATVTAATAGSVAFVGITPTRACLAPRRSDPRARSVELDPACRIGGVHRPSRRVARLAICLTMVLDVGSATKVAATWGHPVVRTCCPNAVVGASGLIDVAAERPGIAVDEHDRAPDQVAHYTGGIAARLRRSDGAPVPGNLYLMMAVVGSDERARLFEQTPFTHDSGPHFDTMEANHLAVEAAAAITGNDIEQVEFTTAPGGGPSGGLIYLIAYLNLVSQGAFTGGVNVAATGQLEDEGYIGHIRAVNEKVGAAHLAGADVLFTSSAPSHLMVAEHATRHTGHLYRSRYGRETLASERGLDDYETWGGTRPDGLDLVVVGHIVDVAAYLCGADSEYACAIADQLGTTTTSDTLTTYDIARAAHTAATDIPLGHPNSGSLQ